MRPALVSNLLATATIMLLLLPSPACGVRIIRFAGRDWLVKNGFSGPGPNTWSDHEQSVWVDRRGLHLKIRKVQGKWYCAEVVSVHPTSYGMHRFYIGSRIDRLDRNVVASPFLYANDQQELDIEFSRWGEVSGPNAQYVVQPAPYDATQRERFRINQIKDLSTHCIDWQASFVRFKSFSGHDQEPRRTSDLLHDSWYCRSSRNPPESAGLHIRFNLYLMGGRAPSDDNEAEFVLTGADLPPPRPATSPAITTSRPE